MQTDFTAELAQLMKFAGDTGTAIRMYSAYSGGSPADYLGRQPDPKRESVELMFLADALHHFSRLGAAIEGASSAGVVEACDGLLLAFADYDVERPEYGARQAKPTFDAWSRVLCIAEARTAIAAIRSKALSASQEN